MKKILIFIILSFAFISNIEAKEKVTLNKCVDGDTAWFNINDKIIKTRFLAIDTPESTNKKEAYGKEASKFTCDMLTNAKKIEIEYDKNSDKTDKYDRHLVWVFVDGKLLQNLIIENGLAEVSYLYDDYEYTTILQASELLAKTNKVGMWEENNFNILYLIIIIIVIIILFIFSDNFRKKAINIGKKRAKKEIKNLLNKL